MDLDFILTSLSNVLLLDIGERVNCFQIGRRALEVKNASNLG